MLRKALPTIVFLMCLNAFSNAQSYSPKSLIPSLPSHFLVKNDTVYRFYAIRPLEKVKTASFKVYYWFKKDTILATKGGFDGWLLNGSYEVFYPNKNLRESGEYSNGLKIGKWKTWFPDGSLQSIAMWRKGIQQGFFKEYRTDGTLLRKGHFRKNKISGIITEYNCQGKKRKLKYKHGLPVKKEKKAKKDPNKKR